MAEQSQQMVRVEVVAQLFNLSVEQVYRLTKSGVIRSEAVKGETGRMYPFIETIKSYVAHLKDKSDGRNAVSDAIKDEELAKKQLETRRLENKVALEEGNAHLSSDVRRVWTDVIGSFRMRLWSLPHTAADRLVNIPSREEVAEILKDEINALCEMLVGYSADAFYARNSDYDEQEADSIEDVEDVEADAETAV